MPGCLLPHSGKPYCLGALLLKNVSEGEGEASLHLQESPRIISRQNQREVVLPPLEEQTEGNQGPRYAIQRAGCFCIGSVLGWDGEGFPSHGPKFDCTFLTELTEGGFVYTLWN